MAQQEQNPQSGKINQNINQATYGLNMDSVPEQVKPGTLTYALNSMIDNFDGHMISYQNEGSNVLCREFKTGYKVIGIHNIVEQNKTVLFMVKPDTNDSEIGFLDNIVTCNYDDTLGLGDIKSSDYVNNGYNNIDCNVSFNCLSEDKTEVLSFYESYKKTLSATSKLLRDDCCKYTTIINAKCLNFNINYPIHKIVHRIVGQNDDSVCGTEIYWTDGLNKRRYINLDDLPFKESFGDCNKIKFNEVDCSLLDVQPNLIAPCITPTQVSDGGNLIAGVYQFAVQYTNKKGQAYSAFYSVTNPISIFKSVFGLDYNFPTDKSIRLEITNLDTNFDYFNLAVIKTINGIPDAELVGTFDVTEKAKVLTYSGNDKTAINLTMDDIFEKHPYYETAKDVTVSNNTLMWADLTSDKIINFQSVASKIKLQWETAQISYNEFEGYNNGINTALYKGYMRDEVYAFEIAFILKNGVQTGGFHIPGRESTIDDLTMINNSDVITTTNDCNVNEPSQAKWKVYNTGSVIAEDSKYINSFDKNCYKGPFEYGNFGYHESAALYPCNQKVWGDLANKPIRHHRMPDNIITHIYNANTNPTNKTFEHKIYPLGLRIDLNNIKQAILQSDLADSIKEEIQGFKILRSDRVNNKTVIAKGLLYNMGSYTKETQSYFYPNYPFNDLGGDPFISNLSGIGEESEFNISSLNQLENSVNKLEQQIDVLKSQAGQTLALSFTSDGTTGTAVIIETTNSELNTLNNKILVVENAYSNLIADMNSMEAYYDSKVQAGVGLCQTDVPNLTVNIGLYDTYVNAVNSLLSDGAFTNFNNIINYINTNSTTLNSHPKSNEIFAFKNSLVEIITSKTNSIALLQDVVNRKIDYDDSLNNTTTGLSTISCTVSVSPSNFSTSRFTFHSPDTHFYQPFLGEILKLETVEGGLAVGNFVQVKDHAGAKLISTFSAGLALATGITMGLLFAFEPKYQYAQFAGSGKSYYAPSILPSLGLIAEKTLTFNVLFKDLITKLVPYKNYAYQYNAVGNYSNFTKIPNSSQVKQRPLRKKAYLLPGVQLVGDTNPINNFKRESSVYLRANTSGGTLRYPSDASLRGVLPADNSRVPYSPNGQIQSNILSFYGSIKRKLIDQYGEMYSSASLDTGYCGKINLALDYTNVTDVVFGGDIFINRFGLKRKLSYFIDTNVNRPEGTDIEYNDLSNIGKVKYWYNTSSGQTPGSGFKGLLKSILGVPQSNLDGNTNKLFYQNGKIYLYSYGIAYFFVESEVNVDNRQAGNPKEKDFYPNMGTGIPNDWLQESYVPIVENNHYIYNKTYSKQNKENLFYHLPITFDPDNKCTNDFTHRVIYSDPNKWRITKPISYFELPKNFGKLTSIDSITNGEILVRFENKSKIYNAMTAIQTSSGKYAYLGNDDVFNEARSIDFGETNLGYAGSQNKLLLKTEVGTLFLDAKRCAIFLLNGKTPEVISDRMMSKWFTNNLSFKILSHFPTVNTDNHYNGVGITAVWDILYNRFLITKLDYEPVDEYKNDIEYRESTGQYYYKNLEILLKDPKYFCNRSWTLSYSPTIKAWVSFHSYLPNFYIGQSGHFKSGINGDFNNGISSVWNHGLIATSNQVFYGKLEPYILEYPFVFKYQDEILQNVKDYTTILEYYNLQDHYEINDGVYFNKAVLYNNQQCSGIRNLYPKPKGRLNEYFNYPKTNSDSIDIMYTKSDNFFNYNQLWDVVKNPNNHNPIWNESCINKSIDKELNNTKFDYSNRSHQKTKLRAKNLKVRHIQDLHSRYKFISKFINSQTQTSEK